MQQTPKKNVTNQKKTKKRTKNMPLLSHWASLGQISVTLGSLLAAFRALLGGLGALLAALGTLLGRSWGVLGASWAPLGPLGRNLEKSQGLGPPYWTSFGELLGHFFAFFRIFFVFVAHLKSSWLILSFFFVFCSIFLDLAWISGGFWEGSGKNFR